MFDAIHKSEDTDTYHIFSSHSAYLVLGTMFGLGPGANVSNEMLFRVAQKSLNSRRVNVSFVASNDFGDTLYRILRT